MSSSALLLTAGAWRSALCWYGIPVAQPVQLLGEPWEFHSMEVWGLGWRKTVHLLFKVPSLHLLRGQEAQQ